jgi:hypothetical protein
MRALLDTSVVIATDVPPLDGDLAISAVTLAELHSGVLVASVFLSRKSAKFVPNGCVGCLCFNVALTRCRSMRS